MNELKNQLTTINGISYCQWPIFIYNCVDSDYFVAMYYGNLITSIILFLLSGIIPSNFAIRELIEDAQWVSSVLACTTYLAGVFVALPKMAFYQPSSTQITKKLYLPSSLLIKRFYWSFVIIQYTSVQASSFLTGLFRMNNNFYLTRLFYMIRSFCYGSGSFVLVLGFGIYGRLLINLTKQSFELIQGQGGIVEAFGVESNIKDLVVDEKKGITRVITRKFRILNNQENKSVIELRKRRFRWRIWKVSSFFYWSIQSFIIGIWYDWVFSTLSVSKNHAFTGCVITTTTAIIMMLGILLSELFKEDTNSTTELMLSNSNNLSQSISIG
ncbi:9681_t:CDS:2 [Diversispora eburnea]|uniref:9681_t:CDS:1 n=1 Tax=Diversispora eburnea TaxID=1213867 RepID=A0A9N8VX02_9GLOM|nr:9681_t:CDS:2 [Diversispora eburnea]